MQTTRREFALLLTSAVLHAQDDPVFKLDVKVVNILANVLGRNHEIINTLAKEDFTVLENGRPQNITYFARQSDLPITIGLLVDTSMSQRRVLDAERGASFRFIDQVLRENKDHFFIMQFDMNVQFRQPLTTSRRELDAALAFVETPTRNQLRNQSGGGTLLFDAVVTASKDVMKAQQGRKALIVLSDGEDFGSDSSLSSAIEEAQRADTLIYAILFSDSNSAEGRRAMMRMARETGAGFFEVTKKLNIEQVFDLIQEELRSQYSLGYVSDVPVRISEFRKIQLLTKQKGLIVQARDRYWARR
ncbi:MAG: VWA domain-containing protein [Bryobacteraceae bacterium]